MIRHIASSKNSSTSFRAIRTVVRAHCNHHSSFSYQRRGGQQRFSSYLAVSTRTNLTLRSRLAPHHTSFYFTSNSQNSRGLATFRALHSRSCVSTTPQSSLLSKIHSAPSLRAQRFCSTMVGTDHDLNQPKSITPIPDLSFTREYNANSAWAICSYFKLPEQGMTEYEVLSRGSVTVIPSSFYYNKMIENTNHKARGLHFFAPKHVTHPFLFKDYYQQEWLSYVREEAVINFLQYRDRETGKVLQEFPLERDVYKSKDRDLAVLHLVNEKDLNEWIQKTSNFLPQTSLAADLSGIGSLAFRTGDDVTMIGHSLEIDDESGEEVLIPRVMSGTVNVIDSKNDTIFINTNDTLAPQGMCGGPIVNKSGLVIGIVEALVEPHVKRALSESEQQFHKTVSGNTVGITYRILKEQLLEIEKEMTKPHFDQAWIPLLHDVQHDSNEIFRGVEIPKERPLPEEQAGVPQERN